ncbi:hypothetical protein [Mycolicibacterium bacteremicum]|uniref:hypothetical protein n=1 Tax=Mycolicibacterium bacteremicum TaxID=564198 RepID=UPI0026EF41B4|nr:hypothetical protein [Mycolicibacterium bacteremicum]
MPESGTTRRAAVTREADGWFLRRGLPSALPLSSRLRGVVPRSAPALVAWAVLMVMSLVATIASGNRDIDIDDDPTASQWLALIVLGCIPIAMALAGHAAGRIRSLGARWAASTVAVAVGLASDWFGDDAAGLLRDTVVDLSVVAAILIATATGVGSVLGWSARVALHQLRSAGRLIIRTLPVVLLTVLVFFNSLVWTIATDLDVPRMSLLLGFLAVIAVGFLISGIRDLLPDPDLPAAHQGLVGTPFEGLPQDVESTPLRRGERANLLLVATISQVTQMVILAAVTGAVFFTMGLIVLTPAVSDKLTGGAAAQSVWFDITLPVSAAHLHVTAFLTALTFMYVSARAVGDGEYRREFLDPLLADMEVAIAARHRYQSARKRDHGSAR